MKDKGEREKGKGKREKGKGKELNILSPVSCLLHTSHFRLYTSYFILLCLLPFPLKSQAAELKEIKRRGYLVVGVKDNLRPLGFRDAKGRLQGLEIDIAQRLAEDLLGKPNAVKFLPVANSDRLNVVLEDKVDLTIARVTSTDSRARLVDFSSPYYFDGTALVAKKGSRQRLKDVASDNIAILKGSSSIATVRYLLPRVQLVGVDSYQQAHSLMESGKTSAFAADASVLSGWIQEYPQYQLLPTLLSAEPLCVVMPKGLQYDELRRQVNAAIASYSASGWLQQRAAFWGLPVDKSSERAGLTPRTGDN